MIINEVLVNLNHDVILDVGSPGIHAVHHSNSLKGSQHHHVVCVHSTSIHRHPVGSVESSTTVQHLPVLSSDEFIIEIETVDHPVAHNSFVTDGAHYVDSVESGDDWVYPVHSSVLGHEFAGVESSFAFESFFWVQSSQMTSATEDVVEEVFPEKSVPHSSGGLHRVWTVHLTVPVARLNSVHLHRWHKLFRQSFPSHVRC
jgi:hypothetical protein